MTIPDDGGSKPPDAVVIDLKVQLARDRIPPKILAALLRHAPLMELIQAANEERMLVTVTISNPETR